MKWNNTDKRPPISSHLLLWTPEADPVFCVGSWQGDGFWTMPVVVDTPEGPEASTDRIEGVKAWVQITVE